MVTQQRMILKWLSFVRKPEVHRDSPADASGTRPWKRQEHDSLPFWRRLLCAPEVRDYSAPTTNFSDCSGYMSLQPFEDGVEIDDACEPKLKSVFAKPRRHASPHQTECSSPLPRTDSFGNGTCSKHGDGCMRKDGAPWVVTDTRRMEGNRSSCSSNFPSSSTPFGPTASPGAASPGQSLVSTSSECLRRQRKEDQRAQLAAELQQRKELQRDEQMLLEEERTRLAKGGSRVPIQLTEENLSKHIKTSTADAVSGGLTFGWNDAGRPARIPSSYNDDKSTSMDCDDVIDLHDINHLFECYKRRGGECTLDSEGGSDVVTPSVAAPSTTETNGHESASPRTQQQRKSKQQQQQRYPLGSRRYIERVLLAEHSQQVFALMWLLAESMRHAWQLRLRLAQLYTYYVPVYLQAEVARRAAADAAGEGGEIGYDCYDKNDEVFSITQSKYYAYFCGGTFDYEYYHYQFHQEWEAMFAAVKNHLESPDSVTSSSVETNTCGTRCDDSAPRGRVCFVAAVLHSLSLFERQWELQVAVRHVERWMNRCWSRLNQAGSPIAKGSGGMRDRDAGATGGGDEPAEAHCQAAATGNREEGKENETDERVYLPMDWWQAQDADVQSLVFWNRRKRKMRQMQIGTEVLRRSRLRESTSTVSTTGPYDSPNVSEALPVTLETLPDNRSDEELESHHVMMRIEDPRSLNTAPGPVSLVPDVTSSEDLEGENDEGIFVFKVAVVGDYNVGKTSIVRRLLDVPDKKAPPISPPEEEEKYMNGETKGEGALAAAVEAVNGKGHVQPLSAAKPTVGMDFFSRVVRNVQPGRNIRLQFWDTAGLERYASVHDSTYRCASAVIVVFDVRNRESFVHVCSQHLEKAMRCNPDLRDRNIFVIGNKVDLIENNAPESVDKFVTQADVESVLFSAFPGVHYFETSAMSSYGIREVLAALCETLPESFTAAAKGEGGEGAATTPERRHPLRSLLPLSCEPETTLGEGTAEENTAVTLDLTVGSLSPPSSLRSLTPPRDSDLLEDPLFSPRECTDRGDSSVVVEGGGGGGNTHEERRVPSGRGSFRVDTTALAGRAGRVTTGRTGAKGASIHTDPNSIPLAKDGEDSGKGATPCSKRSCSHDTVNEKKNAQEEGEAVALGEEEEGSNRSCHEMAANSSVCAGSLPQENSAAPPSVENTARFHANSRLRRRDSLSVGSCGNSDVRNRATAGKDEVTDKGDEDTEVTSHQRRIADKLKRIDEDAEQVGATEGEHGVEQMQEEAPVGGGSKKSPVKLSRCLCFRSKGDGSKRTGC